MILTKEFHYCPKEHEAETASNSYLMSLITIVVGLPFPIINLISTVIFYYHNRSATHFAKWHCTQALVSQLSLFIVNSCCFWWTISILFQSEEITNTYIAYLLTAFVFNITEFLVTVYTAVQTRKGIHVEWWFYGNLTNLLCKVN